MATLFLNGAVAISLVLAAICGDKLVDLGQRASPFKAISDNSTHAVIAGMTWVGVILNERRLDIVSSRCLAEVLVCSFVASAIDLDHFIRARSFHLKDAVTTFSKRPFLHCTTIPVALSCALFCVAYMCKIYFFERISWIILASFLSHHIRDAARRGLWLWPFGSTPPFGTTIYLSLTALFPICLSFFVRHSHFVLKQTTRILSV